MSTIRGHLGMWNLPRLPHPRNNSVTGVFRFSMASMASMASNASMAKILVNVNPVFHSSIVHFRDHANPQQSASGSLPAPQAIPRHGFGSLLLASTQAGVNNLQRLNFNYERNNNKE